ncbi:hypothetical protein [Shewanella sp. 0m-4]
MKVVLFKNNRKSLEAAGFSIIDIKRKLQTSPIGEVTDLFITARLD